MPTRQQNLPPALHPSEKIAILLVSPNSEDEAVLRGMLGQNNSPHFSRCECVEHAMPQIREMQPAVVICERDLPDGSWKTILGTCEALSKPPVVVVVSRNADENLWAEVLNLGGYDVLLKPFDKGEVSRVVESCYRQWSSPPAVRQPVASTPGAAGILTAQFA